MGYLQKRVLFIFNFKNMKPVIQIILSIIFAGIICQLSYLQLEKGLKIYDKHKNERLSELFLKNTNYNLLFIGSSRTHSNINPRVIDSICNTNSYNAGVEGGNLFEFKIVLEAYLQNHPPPKNLILTIDLKSFDINRRFYNYTQYLPYTNNVVLDQVLNKYGHNTTAIKYLKFLVFTNYDDYTKANAIKGLLGKSDIPYGDFQYRGYLSNSENTIQPDASSHIDAPVETNISIEGRTDLETIMQLCSENKTNLIFTYAPEYEFGLQESIANSKTVLLYIDKIAKANNIPFWRDDSLSLCTNNLLFANIGHLNKKGAQVYSGILANEIKSLIKH